MKYVFLFYFLLIRNIRWLYILVFKSNYFISKTVYDYRLILKNPKQLDLFERNIFKQLALDGIRERKASEVMQNFIEKDDYVLEAGANIGYYTLMEDLLIKSGKIYAIEPEANNFSLLKKNLSLNNVSNKKVKTEKLAFANKRGSIKLYKSKSSNLHSPLKSDIQNSGYEVVKAVTIDEYLKDKKKVNFIRMDIEGFEIEVIKGMNNFLQQKPSKNKSIKLFIELHPQITGYKKMKKLLKILEKNNFEITNLIYKDTYIRKILDQTVSKKTTIKELLLDPIFFRADMSFEVFFVKKNE